MLSYNARRRALVSSYSPTVSSPPLVKRPPLLPDTSFEPPESLSSPEAAVRYEEICPRPWVVTPAVVGLGFRFGDWFPEGSDRLQSAFDLGLVSRGDFYETWPDDWPSYDHGPVPPKSSGRTLVKRLAAFWAKVMRRA